MTLVNPVTNAAGLMGLATNFNFRISWRPRRIPFSLPTPVTLNLFNNAPTCPT